MIGNLRYAKNATVTNKNQGKYCTFFLESLCCKSEFCILKLIREVFYSVIPWRKLTLKNRVKNEN